MKISHEPRHEDWLLLLTASDAAELPPGAKDAVENCAECAPQLAELRRLQDELRSVAREDREILAAANELDVVPGVAETQAFGRQKVREAELARGARHSRWSGARSLAAAVALLVLGASMWLVMRDGRRRGALGPSNTIELVAPAPHSGFGHFEWRGEVERGGWFEVEVFAPAEGAATRRALLPVPVRVSTGTQWEPSTNMTAAWPDVIEWRVRGVSSTRADVSSSLFGRAER